MESVHIGYVDDFEDPHREELLIGMLNLLEINSVVRMNQEITHAGNASPWKVPILLRSVPASCRTRTRLAVVPSHASAGCC